MRGPGHESRHNLVYWRYGDYVGIGPGAHGRLTLDGARVATRTQRVPERWLAAVEADGRTARSRARRSPREAQLVELLMMGLRLTRGRPGRADRAGQRPAAARRPSTRRRSTALSAPAGSSFADDRLAATAAGRQRLDGVLRALV